MPNELLPVGTPVSGIGASDGQLLIGWLECQMKNCDEVALIRTMEDKLRFIKTETLTWSHDAK